MKNFLVCIVLLAGFGAPQLLRAQTPTAPDEKPGQPKKRAGIFTMYALDPFARTLCFNDGKEGMASTNHQWGNRCSDLSYSTTGHLVAGIEIDRVAAIVDLGTANELRERNGYEDAENGGVGFASLRLEGDKITVIQADNDAKPIWRMLKESPRLFTQLTASANAPIKLGHIYLVRIADTKDKNFQRIAKLMVIAYRPDEAVTLRWELLN